GIRPVAWRRIVERRGNAALGVHDVVVAQLVEPPRRDPRLHVRRDEIEHLGGEAAGDAHPLDFGGRLDLDAGALKSSFHGAIIALGSNAPRQFRPWRKLPAAASRTFHTYPKGPLGPPDRPHHSRRA